MGSKAGHFLVCKLPHTLGLQRCSRGAELEMGAEIWDTVVVVG